jgi:hypothetical protein
VHALDAICSANTKGSTMGSHAILDPASKKEAPTRPHSDPRSESTFVTKSFRVRARKGCPDTSPRVGLLVGADAMVTDTCSTRAARRVSGAARATELRIRSRAASAARVASADTCSVTPRQHAYSP